MQRPDVRQHDQVRIQPAARLQGTRERQHVTAPNLRMVEAAEVDGRAGSGPGLLDRSIMLL